MATESGAGNMLRVCLPGAVPLHEVGNALALQLLRFLVCQSDGALLVPATRQRASAARAAHLGHDLGQSGCVHPHYRRSYCVVVRDAEKSTNFGRVMCIYGLHTLPARRCRPVQGIDHILIG